MKNENCLKNKFSAKFKIHISWTQRQISHLIRLCIGFLNLLEILLMFKYIVGITTIKATVDAASTILIFSRKRSSCASGNGYVPSNSTGFCVASTVNNAESECRTPSIVTCRSSIDSSSDAWVRGGIRFTSSTSSRSVNIGP